MENSRPSENNRVQNEKININAENFPSRISSRLAQSSIGILIAQGRNLLIKLKTECIINQTQSQITDEECKECLQFLLNETLDIAHSSSLLPIRGRLADIVANANVGTARFLSDQITHCTLTYQRKNEALCGFPSIYIKPSEKAISLIVEPLGLSATVSLTAQSEEVVIFNPTLLPISQNGVAKQTTKSNLLNALQTTPIIIDNPDEKDINVSILPLTKDDQLFQTANQHTNPPLSLGCINVAASELCKYAQENSSFMERLTDIIGDTELDIQKWGSNSVKGNRELTRNIMYIITGAIAISLPVSKQLNSNCNISVTSADGLLYPYTNIAGDLGVFTSNGLVASFLLLFVDEDYFDKKELKSEFLRLHRNHILPIIKVCFAAFGAFYSKKVGDNGQQYWSRLSRLEENSNFNLELYKKQVLSLALPECCSAVLTEINEYHEIKSTNASIWHELSEETKKQLNLFYDRNGLNVLERVTTLGLKKISFLRQLSKHFQNKILKIIGKYVTYVSNHFRELVVASIPEQLYLERGGFNLAQRPERRSKPKQLNSTSSVSAPAIVNKTYMWNGAQFIDYKKGKKYVPIKLDKELSKKLVPQMEVAVNVLWQESSRLDKFLDIRRIQRSPLSHSCHLTRMNVLESNIKEEMQNAIGIDKEYFTGNLPLVVKMFFICTEEVTPAMINYILNQDRLNAQLSLFNEGLHPKIKEELALQANSIPKIVFNLSQNEIIELKRRLLLNLHNHLSKMYSDNFLNSEGNPIVVSSAAPPPQTVNSGGKAAKSSAAPPPQTVKSGGKAAKNASVLQSSKAEPPPLVEFTSFFLVKLKEGGGGGIVQQKLDIFAEISSDEVTSTSRGFLGYLQRPTAKNRKSVNSSTHYFVATAKGKIPKLRLIPVDYIKASVEEFTHFVNETGILNKSEFYKAPKLRVLINIPKYLRQNSSNSFKLKIVNNTSLPQTSVSANGKNRASRKNRASGENRASRKNRASGENRASRKNRASSAKSSQVNIRPDKNNIYILKDNPDIAIYILDIEPSVNGKQYVKYINGTIVQQDSQLIFQPIEEEQEQEPIELSEIEKRYLYMGVGKEDSSTAKQRILIQGTNANLSPASSATLSRASSATLSRKRNAKEPQSASSANLSPASSANLSPASIENLSPASIASLSPASNPKLLRASSAKRPQANNNKSKPKPKPKPKRKRKRMSRKEMITALDKRTKTIPTLSKEDFIQALLNNNEGLFCKSADPHWKELWDIILDDYTSEDDKLFNDFKTNNGKINLESLKKDMGFYFDYLDKDRSGLITLEEVIKYIEEDTEAEEEAAAAKAAMNSGTN